jgi:hypothetical protein
MPLPTGSGIPQAWRLQGDGSGEYSYAFHGDLGDIWSLYGIEGGGLFVTGANLANAATALACKPSVTVQPLSVTSAPAFVSASVVPVPTSTVIITQAPPLPPLQYNAQATSITITEHFVQPRPVCSNLGN